MKRPKIEKYMKSGTTAADIQKKFRDNPELHRYIYALDRYINHLEDKVLNSEIQIQSRSLGWLKE